MSGMVPCKRKEILVSVGRSVAARYFETLLRRYTMVNALKSGLFNVNCYVTVEN